jgi:hypothetical protein
VFDEIFQLASDKRIPAGLKILRRKIGVLVASKTFQTCVCDGDTGTVAVGNKLEGHTGITRKAGITPFIADPFTGDYFGDLPDMRENFSEDMICRFFYAGIFSTKSFRRILIS